MPVATESLALAPQPACYHCGELVPTGVDLRVVIGGSEQPMCCPGCRAVASLIAANGLESFYRQRTAYSERPQYAVVDTADQFRVYDDPRLSATFSSTDTQGLVHASLLLGGMTCAACTWLVEQSMGAVRGVTQALVNLQQARLDIQFDPDQCQLSDIFSRLDRLGYRPRPFKTSAARQQSTAEYRTDLRRLAVAGLGMMQVGMFAIALHAGDIQGMEAQYQALLRWVSLPVAAFVVFYCARPFFTSAWRHLRQGALVMDLPVALAIGLAFAASTWATFSGTGQVYFDSVVMFTFFLLLARFMERRVRQRQMFAWLDAESSLPSAVNMRRDDRWVAVPRIQLRAGDTVLIKPGETVPVDGEVTQGNGAVQEDTFNGEQLPRSVASGDTVYAGTINVSAALEARVLGDYSDSRLAALQRSVEVAQTEKPRLAKLADRMASWFVGRLLLVTSATAAIWLYLAPEKAFWITLSVLVISCPCALALATPAALTNAASALRARGVIVRGENALEALSKCTHLLLDKTGTLTEGALSIARVELLGDMDREELLDVAAALQQFSNHPVSRAFASRIAARGFTQSENRVGAGIEAQRADVTYRTGSAAFCRDLVPAFPDPPDGDLYWIGLCRGNAALAWIGLDDTVRPEAADVIAQARQLGLEVELLTGDSSAQALRLATSLGIEKVHRNQTPEQKMARVQALQRTGAEVAMVGDGLNDAPVLSVANASFAVPGATDLARSQADFVIAGGDLQKIIETLRKARQCRRVIRQNFTWALGYNLCAIPLAAMGYVQPWAAAIGMSLSSLLVVANSLRLNR
jgi:P-type Cu2+ transporter